MVVEQDDNGLVHVKDIEGFSDGTEIIGLLETAKLDLHFNMMMNEMQTKEKKEQ